MTIARDYRCSVSPSLAHFFGAVILLAVISGCVSTGRKPESVTHAQTASELQQWQASGRIAVSGASGGGSGSFTWIQNGSEAKVQMRGPIGIGSLRLTINDRNTHVETGDGKSFDAADAEAELTARLGATIPVQNLRYWLVGLAAPGQHEWLSAPPGADSGAVADKATLTQESWRIDYQKYALTNNINLPTKLVAVSGPAKVRVMIDRWRLQ